MASATIEQTKVCTKCGENKPATLSEFYKEARSKDGLSWRCKLCARIAAIATYEKDRGKAKSRIEAWKKANPEAVLRYQEKYSTDPAKIEAARCRRRLYEERNLERRPEMRRDAERRRWRENTHYRLGKVVAHQIRRSVAHGKKRSRWSDLVGYSSNELRSHLERQFTARMSWENYGSYWEIDHIVPVASFDFSLGNEEIRACWALSNLRPFPAKENNRKSAKRFHLV